MNTYSKGINQFQFNVGQTYTVCFYLQSPLSCTHMQDNGNAAQSCNQGRLGLCFRSPCQICSLHPTIQESPYLHKGELNSKKYLPPSARDVAVTSLTSHCHLLPGHFQVLGFQLLVWPVREWFNLAHVI